VDAPAPEPAAEPAPEITTEAPVLDAPAAPPEAPAVPPVLLSDAEGVRVLAPPVPAGALPEVLQTVALDAIAYDATGDLSLSGRATEGGVVRLYLDNRPLAEVAVAPDGTWRLSGLEVAPGVYTLRVDRVGADGRVTSRIEMPFLREERSAIAAAFGEETSRPDFTIAVRTVQPGNTLWAIAREAFGQGVLYVQVFEANRERIRNPDLIYPGQVLVLPDLAPASGSAQD
jgi:nucleoid-associated protein YgaU